MQSPSQILYTPITDRKHLVKLKTHVIIGDVVTMQQKEEHRMRKTSRLRDTGSRPSTVATSVNIPPGRKRKRRLVPLQRQKKKQVPNRNETQEDPMTPNKAPFDLQTNSEVSVLDTMQASASRRHNPYTSAVFNVKPFDPKHASPPPRQTFFSDVSSAPKFFTRKRSTPSPTNDVEYEGLRILNELRQEERLVRSEIETKKQIISQEIDVARSYLPLTFLFNRGTQDYAQRRALQNVERILKSLFNKQLADGMMQWKIYLQREREKEKALRTKEMMHKDGGRALKVIGKKLLNQKIYRAIRRWKWCIRQMKRHYKVQCAVKIQKWWKNYLGWWNAIQIHKNKLANDRKRDKMIIRTLILEWLSQRRKEVYIAAQRLTILREDSANLIQSAYRLYVKRVAAKQELNERKALACLKRMLNRRLVQSYNSWVVYTLRSIRIKNMMKRALLGTLAFRFELWDSYAQESLRDKRNETVAKKMLRRMLYANANKCLQNWKQLVYQTVSARNLMRRVLAGVVKFRFDLWLEFVEMCKFERKDAAEKRRIENEAKVRRCLQRIKNATLHIAWSSFCENVAEAKENRRKGRQFLKRMMNKLLYLTYSNWVSILESSMKSSNRVLTKRILGLLCGKKQKHKTHDAPCTIGYSSFPGRNVERFCRGYEIPTSRCCRKA